MTQQYGQSGINLIPIDPISTESTSTDLVNILLGVLTDGQTMTVDIDATGSKPSDVTNNVFFSRAIAVFTRGGGSGAVPIVNFPFAESAGGDVTFISFNTNDTNGITECFLTLEASTAELFKNRIVIQKIIF